MKSILIMIKKHKNKGFILMIFFQFLISNIVAQSCLEEGNRFATQSEVDSFKINYPDCKVIIGGIYIKDNIFDPIQNLNSFSEIKKMKALVIDNNLHLTDLHGFDNLEELETLILDSNSMLHSLDGLEKLRKIKGFLRIQHNPQLKNIDGFSSLISIEKHVRIWDLPRLKNLNGFSQIKKIKESFSIIFNDSLINMSGLENIERIEGAFVLNHNDQLQNLDGLDKLNFIGKSLSIGGNENLTNIDGISGISQIRSALIINNNDNLVNLDGFDNLSSIKGYLKIWNNYNLTDISGIRNINPSSINSRNINIKDIEIFNNIKLSNCHVKSICDALEMSNKTSRIVNNKDGCNNKEELLTSCMTGVNNILNHPHSYILYPNPSDGTITIRTAENNIYNISIYDIQGRLLWEQENAISSMDNIQLHLENGTYLMKINPKEGESKIKKFVVIK